MKNKNNLTIDILMVSLCCLMCILSGCMRDNEIYIPQTFVNELEPMVVQPGELVTLTGENMHLISKVYFGNEITVDIKTSQTDRDHQMLSVYVPTGVIEESTTVSLSVLYNSVHRLTVCKDLTIYIAPVIPTVSTVLSEEVEEGDIITIIGTDMDIIRTLQANGESIPMESKNATGITFKVPEVDSDTELTIVLVYDNSLGKDQQLVVPGKIIVKKKS